MSEENRSDQYTPGHKPDMKTLFKDNRVKGIAGIAAIAVIWAIMAQSNSGTHQERVEALEGQLANLVQRFDGSVAEVCPDQIVTRLVQSATASGEHGESRRSVAVAAGRT